MSGRTSEAPPNPYLERLGVGTPDLADLARRRASVRTLVIAALLEHGGAMTRDEIVSRIDALGSRLTANGVRRGVNLASRDAFPICIEADGRLTLDTGGNWLLLLFDLGIREDQRPPPPAPVPPPDDVPISKDELKDGLLGRGIGQCGAARLAWAVVEAAGMPLTGSEVGEYLLRFAAARHAVGYRDESQRLARAFSGEAGERLVLLGSEEQLREMRAVVRRHLWSGSVRPGFLRLRDEERERANAQWNRIVAKAQCAHRGILRTLVRSGEIAAVTVLDGGSRTVRTFVGPDTVGAARDALAGFDVLAGLTIRPALARLGVEHVGECRLIELGSAPTSRRIPGTNRSVRLSPAILIRGSTGIDWSPWTDEVAVACLDRGDRAGLVRTLEGGAKALHAFYAYGVLHRAVRLRVGKLDDKVPVAWAEDGDAHICDLHDSERSLTLEVVAGRAVDFDDPWAQARRVVRAKPFARTLVVRDGDREIRIPVASIQAMRTVEESGIG